MRPEPIVVPGAGKARATTERWFARSSPRQERAAPTKSNHVFRDSGGRKFNRPALQGYACLHGEPLFKDDECLVFELGCFTSSVHDTTQTKALLLDHDPQKVIGSEGLEFANTIDGLAFRFPLDGVANGRDIQDCIDQSSKSCVSVGCYLQESDYRIVAGIKVRFVTKARIEEISLVKDGAVPKTFARLVDLDDVDQDLWVEARKPGFRVDMSTAAVLATLRRIREGVEALAA